MAYSASQGPAGEQLSARITALVQSASSDAALDAERLFALRACWQEAIQLPAPWTASSVLEDIITYVSGSVTENALLDAQVFQAACRLLCEVCGAAAAAAEGAPPSEGLEAFARAVAAAMQLPARVMPVLADSLEALCQPREAAIDHNHGVSATSASFSASEGVSVSVSATGSACELATAVVALAQVALFSKRWLDTAGSPTFVEARDSVRSTLKRPLTRMLVLLVGIAGTAQASGATASALQAVHRELRALGLAAAERVGDGGTLVLAPKELRSFAVVNDTWAAIVAMAVAAAQGSADADSLQGWDVSGLLAVLIGNIATSFQALLVQGQPNQLTVVRFWLQHLSKVALAHPAALLLQLPRLVGAASDMCSRLPPIGGELHGEIWQEMLPMVRDRVFVRICAVITAALNKSPAPSMEAALCAVWLEPQSAADVAQSCAGPAATHAAGQLQMLLLLLLTGAGAAEPSLRAALARICLPAAFDLAAGVAYPAVLASVALRRQHCVSVVAFMAGCCASSGSDPKLRSCWALCERALLAQAAQPHPLRAQLLGDAWACVAGRASADMCMRHTGALQELMLAAAAADAACIEGPTEGPHQRQLVALLARLLRAAAHSRSLEAFAADVTAQGVLVSGDALHLHAAKLRALRLSGKATTVEGFGPAAVAAALERHILQLRNAGFGDGSSSGCGGGSPSPNCKAKLRDCCGVLLCCREWLLLCPQLASQAAAQELSHSIIQVLPPLLSLSDANGEGAPRLCALALRVLLLLEAGSRPAQLVQLLPSLVNSLSEVAEGAAALAGQCASVQPPPVTLFHCSLQHPHWAVRHTALQSLAAYLRGAPAAEGLRSVVPAALLANDEDGAEGGGHSFMASFQQYLSRVPASGQPPSLAEADGKKLQAATAVHNAALLRAAAAVAVSNAVSMAPAAASVEMERASASVATALEAVAWVDDLLASGGGYNAFMQSASFLAGIRKLAKIATDMEARLVLL